MCEQTEINYLDGEVVWVKLGSCWWPGEVVGPEKLPPDLLPSFRKPPIAVVKFFQEDTYEYVKNINSIYKYNCSCKNEFIRKGLYLCKTKPGQMNKFPDDVIHAEAAIGGDTDILTRDEFQETKKESYAGLFGDTIKKTPGSSKKGKAGKGKPFESPKDYTPARKFIKEKSDYRVHILVQGSKTPNSESAPSENSDAAPSTSIAEVEHKEESPKSNEEPQDVSKPTSNTFSTPVASSSGIYSCHACSFSTSRLNVLILHNKTHSVSFIPYTPSPVRKKLSTKPPSKSTPNTSKTPKIRRPRIENSEKVTKKASVKKRGAEEKGAGENNAKKSKTDEEIKSSLLADWDDGDEESIDESSNVTMVGSPEVPVAAGSPAVPTPAELPTAQVPHEISSVPDKKSDSSSTGEKPESSSDSKYEFCEDEDWPEETDAGRKIPRVMNPKRKEETKSLSLDEDDVAREVAELLNKTTVPDLPGAPEPLKAEENFPEPSIVKSPDKNDENSSEQRPTDKSSIELPPTKAIFKTKTFFRSRHSRSQDAIGKYVAEQLNAVERMDISESDINGSEVASSPEPRESSPIEHVKVARLAPKIQLKKMKAEAAQLREREKFNEYFDSIQDLGQIGDDYNTPSTNSYNADVERGGENEIEVKLGEASQDVLYPTQEIKPVNTEDSGLTKLNKAHYCEDLNVMKCNAELIPEPIQEDNILLDNKSPDVTPEIVGEEQLVSTNDIVTVQEPDITSNPPTEMKPDITCNPPTEMKTDINDIINEDEDTVIKHHETNLENKFKPLMEPYMNESTASAVDALLSVSREADRVTRIISNDLPEDLFEDDNKDNAVTTLNGLNEYVQTDSSSREQITEKSDDAEFNLDFDDSVKSIQVTKDCENHVDEHANEQVNEEIKLNKGNIMATCEQTVMVGDPVTNMGSIPSESDLQIAETLINLPSTAIQNKVTDNNEIVGLSIPFDNEMISEEAVHTTEDMVVDEEIDTELKNEKRPKKVELRGESLLISNKEVITTRFETEQEKSENLNAAQSLVQMSESIDHKLNIAESSGVKTKDLPDAFNIKPNNGVDSISMLDQSKSQLSNNNINDLPNNKIVKFDASTSKLLKILEEPCTPKLISKTTPTKQVIVSGKEKILNFDVAKSSFKGKPQVSKQKIIIRRAAPNKKMVGNISEVSGSADKIILSRSNNPAQDGSTVQSFTIQTTPDAPSDANTIIIQQKIRKITKPPAKLHKLKPQTSLISTTNESKVVNEMPSDDAIYDINSMPIVLSEELLTAESIEKMPIVMTDGNIITQSTNPSKLVKSRQTVVESEKLSSASTSKSEVKTLLINPGSEVNKVTTPNILSKSSKLRGAKPMLIIDKTTGKQKIVMTKAEPSVKEPKSVAPSSVVQPVAQSSSKSEKFIILSTPNSPRPARTQKILIDPQTGKAHVLLSKGTESQSSSAENKPVSAKLVPSSSSDVSAPGNTVMIITNAQGTQSRIVLTPEHEKILFPNKQQPNASQLKTIAHRITTNSGVAPKTVTTSIAPLKTQMIASSKAQTIIAAKPQVVSSTKTQVIASPKTQIIGSGKVQTVVSAKPQLVAAARTHTVTSTKTPALAPAKAPTRIVPKQKSAIITSKGQLIVGGRVATATQNIAPLPEIRTAPKRIVAPEPKKLIQTIQKSSSEPLIFLQQKSGQVVQLTAAQFDHMQRTGQIINKAGPPVTENKIVIQKPLSISSIEGSPIPAQKQRIRKTIMESPSPMKKMKQEIAIAPAPVPISPVPALSPMSNAGQSSLGPSVSNNITTTTNYPDLENFEELLPSTAIVRQPEPVIIQPEPVAPPPPAPLSDGQLLAVPGEHFGGPPGSFYLCVEDNGTLTPIDNGPLVLEDNQLVPMTVDPLPVLGAQPERRDILEAALANSDVFHAETPRDEAPDFRDLNANVSVHCRVSETSSILNQPIMTPVEVPSKVDTEPTVPANLEDGLAVIGVTPHSVPTSLELPITVTDPRIAPKTTDPLSNNNYGTRLLPSPNTDMSFMTTDDTHVPMGGPISMPILTDDESVGKSMPILTDDLGERTASSVESTLDSPCSLDVRESEAEDSGPWARRLLTPVSDTSEASAEIPLQPTLQLSVGDLSHHHS